MRRGAIAAHRVPVAVLTALVAATWLALCRLAIAFWRSELDWEYVAEQSRRGAPWYYRVAGVWGGMPGSLLLFTAIVTTVALVALWRRGDAVGGWFAVGTVAALLAIDLVLASPFGRLDVPAVEGFGLTPILEHPAMAVHPPLLYLGLACALPAFLAALRGDIRIARRWLLGTASLVLAAMTVGAAWSYMEQGWGGYWAWDPVENTSLLVWLAAVAALHAVAFATPAAVAWLAAAPWVLVVSGAALVRSGAAPSIHGFAEQAAVGWSLVALLAATVIAFVALRPRLPRRPTALVSDRRRVAAAALGLTAAVVLAGTLTPHAVALVGGRASAVRGSFYARSLLPVALVAIPFLAARLRRWQGASSVAHAGVLVLAIGVGASAFDRSVQGPVTTGATVRAAGVTITNTGVEVLDGDRRGTTSVVARLLVDGERSSPAIVVHPDRGGRLAEVATHPGLWRDVQVELLDAADDGTVVVTVRTRPLVWMLWLGPFLIAAATGAAALTRRRAARSAPVAARDEPSVGAGVAAAPD